MIKSGGGTVIVITKSPACQATGLLMFAFRLFMGWLRAERGER